MGKQRGALVLAALLVLIIFGWWKLSTLQTPPSAASHTSIVIHHTLVDGANVYSGLLESAGVCKTISSGISASGQSPAHIMLLLATAPHPGTCTLPANPPDDFSVSFQSTDTHAPVLNGVVLNGAAVAYTLVESN